MPPGEGYYRSRIPCPEDERVASVVRAFSESSPGRQAVFREAVDGVRAGLLLVFSERMAALAVRMESAQPIVQGLIAASLAQEGDPREALAVPALHRRSRRDPRRSTPSACSTRPPAAPTSRAPTGCATSATPRTAPRTSATKRPTTARASATSARSPASPATATERRRPGVGSQPCSIRCWAEWSGTASSSTCAASTGRPTFRSRLVAGGTVAVAVALTLAVLRARAPTTPSAPSWRPARLAPCGPKWPSHPHPPCPATSNGCPARAARTSCASELGRALNRPH